MDSRRRVNSTVMHLLGSFPLMKVAILLGVVGACLACGAVQAQTRWQTSTSPDKTFSVEVPAPLRKVAGFSGEHGVSLTSDEEDPTVASYAVIETIPDDARFGLNVLEVPKSMRSRPRAKHLWYLGVMLIGDDDNPRPKLEKRVKVNGLTGTEYFFNIENHEMHTRGRIFDTGRRIYVITFVGRDLKDLTSVDAERFLNSFRLLKRPRTTRRRA
jgi:hypothetical protein